MSRQDNDNLAALTRALHFIEEESAQGVAGMLHTAYWYGQLISYERLSRTAANAGQILQICFDWRLLLPSSGVKGLMAWEDAKLIFEEQSMFKLPNIVARLVEEAQAGEQWKPETAVSLLCPCLSSLDLDRLCLFLQNMHNVARGNRVNVRQLYALRRKFNLDFSVERLIIEFKAAAVFSPELLGLSRILVSGTPMYELNPAVFETL